MSMSYKSIRASIDGLDISQLSRLVNEASSVLEKKKKVAADRMRQLEEARTRGNRSPMQFTLQSEREQVSSIRAKASDPIDE